MLTGFALWPVLRNGKIRELRLGFFPARLTSELTHSKVVLAEIHTMYNTG